MNINVPDMVRAGDATVVASASGGKDSTALMLALREADVPFRAVFADTGWEARETYEYIDLLREKIGPIDVVGVPGGMAALATKRAGFPMRTGRWCTQELKLRPLREYHEAIGCETVSAIGVRGQESSARAALPEWSDDDEWGGFVWRPLIAWKVEDVIAIHHRHAVPLNPLYLRGHDRVGCYPCIFSQKDEVRLIAENDPERIEQIARMEDEFTAERARRNDAGTGKFRQMRSTFFPPVLGRQWNGIRDVVAWSRTSHGGRQLALLAPPPQGGCMRWGMCEAPVEK
jgi:3'-phosphoadenosine 5'-phosphosulfate sulfotransferase (PAPS reductase)/FAD synthetase